MIGTYSIVPVKGHYEAYSEDGKFVLSGDTWDECYLELKEIIVTESKQKCEVA